MSHLFDSDGTLEKLIILRHFAHGSRLYCREQLIGSEQDIGNEKFDEYWGWIKGLAGAHLLECSIRLRVLLDTVAESEEAKQIPALDALARSELKIGQVLEGDFELTLRESCNKIIHARRVIPIWATDIDGDAEFKYWTGDFELSGTKGSRNWRLLLHVAAWATCIERFLKKADSAELTLYVGQDWY